MSHQAAPFFYVIVGAPGAGKSSQIEFLLGETRGRRRMVFDIEHEYGKHGQVVSSTEAARLAVIAAGKGAFSIVYQPPDMVKLRDRFHAFCLLAFAARDVILVVDELADVDSPNPYEVPEGWKLILRRGRKREVRVVAGTQRPADVNNRLWSFATRLRIGWLADSDDQRELARALGVQVEEVAALKPLEWIERNRLASTLERGRIEWRSGAPHNVPRQVEVKKTLPAAPEARPDSVRPRAMRPRVAKAARARSR